MSGDGLCLVKCFECRTAVLFSSLSAFKLISYVVGQPKGLLEYYPRVSHSQFILADSDKGSRKVLLKVFEIHDMQRAKVYVALYATKMVSPVNQVR